MGAGWAVILSSTLPSAGSLPTAVNTVICPPRATRSLQPTRDTAATLADPQRAPQRIAVLLSFFPIPNMPEPRRPRRLLLSARLITPNSPSRYCVQAELPPLIAVIFSSACAAGRGDVPGILILHSRLTPAARMRPLHHLPLLGELEWRSRPCWRKGQAPVLFWDQASQVGASASTRPSQDVKAGSKVGSFLRQGLLPHSSPSPYSGTCRWLRDPEKPRSQAL